MGNQSAECGKWEVLTFALRLGKPRVVARYAQPARSRRNNQSAPFLPPRDIVLFPAPPAARPVPAPHAPSVKGDQQSLANTRFAHGALLGFVEGVEPSVLF